MPVNPIPDSASFSVSPNGPGGETIKLFALDGNTQALVGLPTPFITDDEHVIQGDLAATAAINSQTFGSAGTIEEDMTVHSAPVAFNDANFTTPGLGITTQTLLLSTHSQFITATVPNMFIESGPGNDTLVGLSGTNILDGGSGQNTYYGGSGQNTFVADARTADASEFIANMKSGDNVIVAGNFGSLAAGVTPSGLDFQLTGFSGKPSAEVLLSGVMSTAGLQVGLDTNNATGVPFFFIHMS